MIPRRNKPAIACRARSAEAFLSGGSGWGVRLLLLLFAIVFSGTSAAWARHRPRRGASAHSAQSPPGEKHPVEKRAVVAEEGPLAVSILGQDPLLSNDEVLNLEVEISGLRGAADPTLRLEINGQPIVPTIAARPPVAPPGQPRQGAFILRVAAPSVDCAVVVGAGLGQRMTYSAPLRVLRFQSSPTTPRLFALAIGVSSYRDARVDLRYAAKDARDFADALRQGVVTLYRDAEIRVLTDKDATRDSIQDGLRWLSRSVTPADVAVLFLAGHGLQEPTTGEYHFLAHDSDVAALRQTGLSREVFLSLRSKLPGRLLLFLDSCHAGDVWTPGASKSTLESLRLQELSRQGAGTVVFASAEGSQAAREAAAWNNGAFTRALVEGLRGSADYNRNGLVSVSELELYVYDRVRAMTLGAQMPVTAKPFMIPDFAIATAMEIPQTRLPWDLGPAPLLFAAVVVTLAMVMRRRPQLQQQLSLPLMVLRNSIDSLRAHVPGCTCHLVRAEAEGIGPGAVTPALLVSVSQSRRGRRPVEPNPLLCSVHSSMPLSRGSLRRDVELSRSRKPSSQSLRRDDAASLATMLK